MDETKKEPELSKSEQYYQMLQKDITLNEVNLSDRTKMCPQIKSKWVKIYHDESRQLKRAKKAEKDYVNSVFKNTPNKPKFQIEAEMVNDPTMKKLRDFIEEQDVLVAFLKDVLSTVISSLGYDISTAVKFIELEQR
jgi:hypothetical protein